ncbi:MAG: hypothetical protein LQ341_002373 [Variospora aurantia]|nr:MAG: hypothetical protein LQ341_002373 [Variospora aurantia]
MSEIKPPSPPPSATATKGFEDGFFKLVQHNAATQYQPMPYQAEGGPYLHSAPTTSYNSPEPRHMMLDQYNQRYYQTGIPSYHGGGLPYGTPAYTTSPYQFGSPLTPEASDTGTRGRRTRTVKHTPANGSPSLGSQGSSSPMPKRSAKKSKSEAVGEASISAPLSQLCLDVPVVDVFEKVNRSIENRQEEARRDNKIKRPSNSFMLYRSAYGDRVKALYPQNNHQIISRICGASWKMETPDVTEKFKAYYEMEKENHAKAHPTYKFSPAKTSPSRKRKGTGESDDEEEIGSELGDVDGEYRPQGSRRSRQVKTPRIGTPTSFPSHGLPGLINTNYGLMFNQNLGYNPSSWQMTNPGKPMPAPMHDPFSEQYYQTTVYQKSPDVQDIFVRRAEPQATSSHALIGLPGGSHDELLALDSAENSPSPKVDPLLLNYEGGPGYSGDLAHDQDFRNFDHQGLYENGWQSNDNPGNTPYHSAFDPWSANGQGGHGDSFPAGGEFDWLE